MEIQESTEPDDTSNTFEWKPRNVIKLIDFYRENPSLWDGTLIKRDTTKRHKLLEPLSENLGVEAKCITTQFSTLRNRYCVARTVNNSSNLFVKPLQFLELVYNMTDSNLTYYVTESAKYSIQNTEYLAELEEYYKKFNSWNFRRKTPGKNDSSTPRRKSSVSVSRKNPNENLEEGCTSSHSANRKSSASVSRKTHGYHSEQLDSAGARSGKQKFSLSDTEIYILAG